MDRIYFDSTCETILSKNAEGSMPVVITAFRQYLTTGEELQIRQQFHSTWCRNNQVMWSGILRECAQAWADEHDMATLTTAMGPLMTPGHPLCLKSQKSSGGWSKYIKGASALFAWHILRGERVIVLSPPPPERFHPSGQTNYQAIEEPILKREKEGGTRLRLEMVHPMVKGAEDFIYQIWPVDQTNSWVERFGTLAQGVRCWRLVKGISEKARVKDTSKYAVKDGVITRAQKSEFDENNLLLKEQAALKQKKALKAKAALKTQVALKEQAALKQKKKTLKKQAALKEQAALKQKKALKAKAALKEQAALKEKKALKHVTAWTSCGSGMWCVLV
jgi:hypothetical protein